MNQTEEANAESHYLVITVAVIIMVIGVYLRFADFKSAEIISNIIFIGGIAVGIKGVFGILQ